jgi:hypothetical protein
MSFEDKKANIDVPVRASRIGAIYGGENLS